MTVKVLFVCLGNICRSPTAEGVFRALVEKEGLSDSIEIDSCGTADWHHGKSPDPRTVAAAKTRGYDLSPLRARQIKPEDLNHFDYVLPMDNSNVTNIHAIAPSDYSADMRLFLHYADRFTEEEVPDPYYGGNEGFSHVLDLVENAAAGLLQHIKTQHLS